MSRHHLHHHLHKHNHHHLHHNNYTALKLLVIELGLPLLNNEADPDVALVNVPQNDGGSIFTGRELRRGAIGLAEAPGFGARYPIIADSLVA